MLKLTGAVLVLASCAGMGALYAREHKDRIRQLQAIRQIFLMLRGEIDYARVPLHEAFCIISGRVGEPFGVFLRNVGERMESLAGEPFRRIFAEQVDTDLGRLNLAKEDVARLKELGEGLGYLNGDMQLKTLDLYLQQLETDIGEARERADSRNRVSWCLGIMGGLFAVIILY